MTKDYDIYINNELNKLSSYANYLLDFDKKYGQELYGLNSDINTYNRKNRENGLNSAYEKVMTLYNELKTIGEKGRDNPNLESDIKAFRKKLYEADLPIFEGSTDKQDEIYNLLEYAEIKKELEQPKWIMPCEGEISSPFGWRKDPKTGEQKYHNGWDIKVNSGTLFKAVADGTVYFAGLGDSKGYAHFIVIDHGVINGKIVTSEYGHISSHYVSKGLSVKQGQIIGTTGNAGKSTGPHLHLTIRQGHYKGIGVNPGIYIRN